MPTTLSLPAGGEIHVWRGRLNLSNEVERLRATLSPDELQRAGRLRFENSRNRFIAARAILRMLIGSYLDVDPRILVFGCSQKGKPELGAGFSGSDLRFNLSHSHDRVVFAFSRGRETGVDVEKIRPLAQADEIARRYFAQADQERIRRLRPRWRLRAFFRSWTRLEARIKISGDGLFSPAPVQENDSGFEVRDVPIGHRYAAAVALDGPIQSVRYFNVPSV